MKSLVYKIVLTILVAFSGYIGHAQTRGWAVQTALGPSVVTYSVNPDRKSQLSENFWQNQAEDAQERNQPGLSLSVAGGRYWNWGRNSVQAMVHATHLPEVWLFPKVDPDPRIGWPFPEADQIKSIRRNLYSGLQLEYCRFISKPADQRGVFVGVGVRGDVYVTTIYSHHYLLEGKVIGRTTGQSFDEYRVRWVPLALGFVGFRWDSSLLGIRAVRLEANQALQTWDQQEFSVIGKTSSLRITLHWDLSSPSP